MPRSQESQGFAVLPEHSEALLRLLGAHPIAWDAVAAEALFMPTLLFSLFRAMPLGHCRLGSDLRNLVRDRLVMLGEDALKTAALLAVTQNPERAARSSIADDRLHSARTVAEFAHRLALETGYAYPDEAFLTGLWHNLGELAGETPPTEAAPPAQRAAMCAAHAAIAETCELPPPAIDALALRDADFEYVLGAHPLARLVWSAVRLSANDWDTQIAALEQTATLSKEALRGLRVDLISIHSGSAAEAGKSGVTSVPFAVTRDIAASTPALFADTLRMAAVSGLLRNAFHNLDADLARQRLDLSASVLCGIRPSLIILADDDRLVPLYDPPSGLESLYQEIGQRLDDETSVIALAIRSGTPTSRIDDPSRRDRSAHDWHVARWLKRDGFICLPFAEPEFSGAVIVGVDRQNLPGEDARRMLVALAVHAIDATLRARHHENELSALRADVESRYREHARRIAHEANNPLTVIKSYLALMSQKHPGTGEMNDEMRIVQSELDRIGRLLEAAAAAPVEESEPDFCHVTELLHDLRAIYGEALFASRGIHFELRTLAGLPPVAMPASALRQVLLNLLRNAAEVLHPGGRCTVALAGQLLTNGARCVEIRVIDNGQGLPPDRLNDLFSPRPSGKGGEHQGVGLSIVNELLRKWDASILCRSQEGTGTSFQLLVPVKNSG